MNDMAELLQPHKVIDLDCLWLANTINVVASQINEHNVLCPILLRIQENLTQLFVLCEVITATLHLTNGEEAHLLVSFRAWSYRR